MLSPNNLGKADVMLMPQRKLEEVLKISTYN